MKLNPNAKSFVPNFGAAPAAAPAPAPAAAPAQPQFNDAPVVTIGKKAAPAPQADAKKAAPAQAQGGAAKAAGGAAGKPAAAAKGGKADAKPAAKPAEAKAEVKKEEKKKAEPKKEVENWMDDEPAAEEKEKKDEKKEEKEKEKKEEKEEKPSEDLSAAVADLALVEKKSEGPVKFHDTREHLNIVAIGHVDAGKSTISGQILLLTGQVDERTIAKYEKEAKEKNRDSWYLAYIMDTNEEERAKGKTVEVGRAHFTTPNKRYTLLDAPGHKNYVPNMIGGTAQADVGVLVISARKGEFETGFDRGGQTREHAMLAKTLGIQRLIVMVNKMDDPTVKWSKERYDQIESKLSPFLQAWGYNLKTEVQFLPVSGYTGANLKDRVKPSECDWFKGESFLEMLDNLRPLERNPNGAVRVPVVAKYKDMGVVCVLGKIECGTVKSGMKLRVMPSGREVICIGLIIEDVDVEAAGPGENVVIKLRGCEEEDIQSGNVISDPVNFPKRAKVFDAQIAVLDLLEHKPLLTVGYSAIVHIHTLSAECQIIKLISETDKKTNQKKLRPKFARSGAYVEIRVQVEETIAIETFKDYAQMGRFTLRDEGKTIAVGKITAVHDLEK